MPFLFTSYSLTIVTFDLAPDITRVNPLLNIALILTLESNMQLQLYEPFENNYESITIEELTIKKGIVLIKGC
jgi:hypothetical protein